MKTNSPLAFSVFLCMPFAGCSIEGSDAPDTQEDGIAVNKDTSKPDAAEGPDRGTAPPAAASKGPCLLGVPTRCFQDGKFEVLIDGTLAGTFRDRGAGEGPRRVIFQGGGQVTITFRIYRQEELAYQPTITTVVEPETMLASNWKFADEKPVPDFGPGPDQSFPALIADVPKSVWCWFGPSPIHKDLVRIRLEDETMVPGVRKLLSEAKYNIIQENRHNAGKTIWWKARIPNDKTIVEAILELEALDGIKSVHAEVTHVY